MFVFLHIKFLLKQEGPVSLTWLPDKLANASYQVSSKLAFRPFGSGEEAEK